MSCEFDCSEFMNIFYFVLIFSPEVDVYFGYLVIPCATLLLRIFLTNGAVTIICFGYLQDLSFNNVIETRIVILQVCSFFFFSRKPCLVFFFFFFSFFFFFLCCLVLHLIPSTFPFEVSIFPFTLYPFFIYKFCKFLRVFRGF